jgi:hypothetical protein
LSLVGYADFLRQSNAEGIEPTRRTVVNYFAVFLCGFAPLREISGAREQLSRKDAKSQRRAESN